MHSFRRSARIKLTLPLVVIAIAIVILQPSLTFFVLVIMLFWIAAALPQYFKRLTISPDVLQMNGYAGGPIKVSKDNIYSVHYVKMKPIARGAVDMFFLEIKASSGNVRIWRYGWGSKHRDLFRRLTTWLSNVPIKLDDDVRKFLESASH